MGNCFLYKRGFGGGFGGGGGGNTPEVEKTASGKVISILDSIGKPLKGLRLFGKTTQNGTPSPTAPVPLVSAGDGGSIIVTIGTSESDANPQTLTVSTPNGLPGIHVSEGGNYTDENGWQWICDEVDFARGKYVQWTKTMNITDRFVVDSGENKKILADLNSMLVRYTGEVWVSVLMYPEQIGEIHPTLSVLAQLPVGTDKQLILKLLGSILSQKQRHCSEIITGQLW